MMSGDLTSWLSGEANNGRPIWLIAAFLMMAMHITADPPSVNEIPIQVNTTLTVANSTTTAHDMTGLFITEKINFTLFAVANISLLNKEWVARYLHKTLEEKVNGPRKKRSLERQKHLRSVVHHQGDGTSSAQANRHQAFAPRII